MNVKTLLTVAGVISLLFGIFFLLAPDAAANFYGGAIEQAGHRLAIRFLGAATLGTGIIYLMGARAAESYGRKAILAGGLAISILGIILSFYGMSDGVLSSSAWVTIVIDLLFAVGFGMFLSKEKPS